MAAKKIWFFDLLRCIAAIAVVIIHVLGPYREQLGQIPQFDWITAITFNSFSRWAVPVFILISGALLLSNPKPIEANYFITRRVSKVLIPFVAWSLFYAGLAGVSLSGFDGAVSINLLKHAFTHETYYHLGFFYYFIPLYLLVPLFHFFVHRAEPSQVRAVIGVWLIFTLLFLLRVDGPWSNQYVLYSGYLLLGYGLYQYQRPKLVWLLPLGVVALLLTDWMVVHLSLVAGEYTVGRWLSYKTLNTVLIASLVFVGCRWWAERCEWSVMAKQGISFISRYSLGVYLLHPLFLWPVIHLNWYFAPPLITIPFWTLVCGGLALLSSWLLSKSRYSAWLVP
ncbi:acyltransferase [Photobacterium damselae]|uniref:acyltransferase n=1 Tax=Photobacterium damselae TaxID=38293 RepID=UPI0040696192